MFICRARISWSDELSLPLVLLYRPAYCSNNEAVFKREISPKFNWNEIVDMAPSPVKSTGHFRVSILENKSPTFTEPDTTRNKKPQTTEMQTRNNNKKGKS